MAFPRITEPYRAVFALFPVFCSFIFIMAGLPANGIRTYVYLGTRFFPFFGFFFFRDFFLSFDSSFATCWRRLYSSFVFFFSSAICLFSSASRSARSFVSFFFRSASRNPVFIIFIIIYFILFIINKFIILIQHMHTIIVEPKNSLVIQWLVLHGLRIGRS